MDQTHAVTLKLDGADMLVQALNDHMETLKLAQQLAQERDQLQLELTELRSRFKEQI